MKKKKRPNYVLVLSASSVISAGQVWSLGFTPVSFQRKLWQLHVGGRMAEDSCKQYVFLPYLLAGFADDCSESLGTRSKMGVRQRWLRRQWQAYLSQEREWGEVGRNADGSLVSSTDSWSKDLRLRIVSIVEWGIREKYCSTSSSTACGKKCNEGREISKHEMNKREGKVALKNE